MTRPRTLIWLHRVGYATTAIVAAELLGLSILGFHLWNEDRQRLAYAKEQTRTHQGAIVAEDARYRPDELDLLATLPPLDAHGLRFVAMPSLRDSWFAVAITVPPQVSHATGVVKVFAHPNGQPELLKTTQTITFSMPKSAANHLLVDVERLTNDWRGERFGCLDGTSVAFELAVGDSVTSGAGNSACSDHYGNLSLIVLNRVRHLISTDRRPAGKDWRPVT